MSSSCVLSIPEGLSDYYYIGCWNSWLLDLNEQNDYETKAIYEDLRQSLLSPESDETIYQK